MSKWRIASDFGASDRTVHLLSIKTERQYFDNFKCFVTMLQTVVDEMFSKSNRNARVEMAW